MKLIKPTLNCFSGVAAQFKKDAKHFEKLGLDKKKLTITGSIKYDLKINPHQIKQSLELRNEWLSHKSPKTMIFISASTHEQEEQLIIKAFMQARNIAPNLLLVIVPRHPERFNEVYSIISAYNLNCVKRSTNEIVLESTEVILADTMGEMLLLYGASDIAFVGGSLINRGGHNLLEPAAIGLPILTGSHVFNFNEIAKQLLQFNALKFVEAEPDNICHALLSLCQSKKLREEMGGNGRSLITVNQGATEKQLNMITQGYPI